MLIHVQHVRLLREIVRPHDPPGFGFCIALVTNGDLVSKLRRVVDHVLTLRLLEVALRLAVVRTQPYPPQRPSWASS